jgi:putative transposase
MTRLEHLVRYLLPLAGTLLTLLVDALHYFGLCLRSPAALAAESLFLRKQLALYCERNVKPRRATPTIRISMVWLGRHFDWHQALTVVQPTTFIRWHRQGFRLFWRWRSHPGRPSLPMELRALIRRMARDNPSWGEARLATELVLELGIQVLSRTVQKYMPRDSVMVDINEQESRTLPNLELTCGTHVCVFPTWPR